MPRGIAVYSCLLLLPAVRETISVRVASLQEDGVFSASSHLRYRNGIPRDIRDFTLCAWLSLNYLRGELNYWLSIGNDTHEDLLSGVFVYDADGPRIVLTRYHEATVDDISAPLDREGFDLFQSWHHYCFVFSSYPSFQAGNLNLTNKIFLDGVFFREETRVIPKGTFTEIPAGSTYVLGQKLDNSRLDFSSLRSFCGRYADVSLWRGELVAEEIKSLSNCRLVSTRGVVMDWNLAHFEGQRVQVSEVERASLCRPLTFRGVMIFGNGAPYGHFRFLCDKLGGRFPTYDNPEDRRAKYAQMASLFEQSFSFTNVSCSFSDTLLVWTGLSKDTSRIEDMFLNTYTGLPAEWDVGLWPGPAASNISCTVTRGPDHLAKQKCDSWLPCAFCQNFNVSKRLVLRGLCPAELEDGGDFDTEYYVHGMINERMHFRGMRASHIFFDSTDGRWTLQSLKNPKLRSKLAEDLPSTSFPLGRLLWLVNNTDTSVPGICQLMTGEHHLLTFSDCHPSKFTCSDGQCLDLERKCNSIVDCADGSDEAECHFLVVDKSYHREEMPTQKHGEPVQVYFSIDIAAVPEVDSSRLRLRSDYDVHLRWYDPRLKFRDLRPQPEFNALGDSDRAHLWRPNIGVVNALGPRNDLGGDDALDGNNRRGEGLMRLVREAEKPLPDDYSLPREAKVYSGKTNSIELKRRYSKDHACKFDLYYFPFDSQVCSMVFELRDRTEDFILFEPDPDTETISYRGDRALNHYDVEREDLSIGRSDKNFSQAVVSLVLRHRTEFHVVNAFVQTLVVLAAAFATFFFEADDFSDRIMVNAVLLLVMATINSSIQAGVPDTSYFKLIDTWLLFCVVMIVVVIFLHTLIAAVLGHPNKKTVGHAFRRIRTPSGSSVGRSDGRGQVEDEDAGAARLANYGAMAFFLLAIVVFNVVFWILALKEFNMPAEDILQAKKPPIR